MARTKFQPKAAAAIVNVGSEKPPINRKKRARKVIEREEIDNRHFVMIDGEGKDDNTKDYYYEDPTGNCYRISDHKCVKRSQYQKYVLLCASTGESIYNEAGLSTGECLHWLCDLGIKYPRAIFIVFGGGYDATMWLRELTFTQWKDIRAYMNVPDKSKAQVPKSGVYQTVKGCYNYGIDYLPRKYISITRFEVELLPGKKKTFVYKRGSNGKKVRHGHITLWDVWGFFQSKFVTAIEEYGLLKDVDDMTFLKNMKDSRDQFSHMDIETITKYCFMECRLGVQLMDKVKLYVGELGLKLKRWDGAGALASALMTMHDIKKAKGEPLPDLVEEACRHAFSGGRIELIQYGHTDKIVYDADINSAYPTITAQLPNMNGTWKLSREIESEWSLIHIKWNLSSDTTRFYPFFYRDADACISYPTRGENWVHLPELQAYLDNKHLYSGNVEILEVWNFFPATNEKPFAFVPELAAKRLVWKKLYRDSGGNEGGQHMMAKCGLNSLFGKTAQTVGMYVDTEGKIHLPPFFNLYWAGRITGETRARIFNAACKEPNSVIMFATDGLFTTKKVDLPYSEDLGGWEPKNVIGMTFVQSGVYYSTKHEKTRGFKKGSIPEEKVLDFWSRKIWKVTGETRVFITYGMIATSSTEDTIEQNMKRLANWEDKVRELHLTPNGTKREYDPDSNPLQKRGPSPAKRLIPTIPKWNDSTGISYPYEIDLVYLAEIEEHADIVQTEE